MCVECGQGQKKKLSENSEKKGNHHWQLNVYPKGKTSGLK